MLEAARSSIVVVCIGEGNYAEKTVGTPRKRYLSISLLCEILVHGYTLHGEVALNCFMIAPQGEILGDSYLPEGQLQLVRDLAEVGECLRQLDQMSLGIDAR